MDLRLPHAKVTAAEPLTQFPPPDQVDPKGPAPVITPFCRVRITARPTPDSDIRIELWLPARQSWNGRYLQVGNGGFAGRAPYRALMAGLVKGYAVAGTDDGHQARTDHDSTDASWALGHPQKVIDFGWRALKETTDASKAVIAAYAGPPKFSYFNGCSDGGREALMEAQRFPADFDGIVAGDPANDWTQLQAAGAVGQTALWRSKESVVSIAKLAALQAAARKACADDTGVIPNPHLCHFDPSILLCHGRETDQCLTKAQLAAITVQYAGAPDGHGGRILPGLEPGAEAEPGGWGPWVIGDVPTGGAPSLAYKFNQNFFADVVYGRPDYDLRSFNYARDMPAVHKALAPILDATNPDLSAFKAHGGKLIQYHGWADPAISSRLSIAYFQRVQTAMGDTQDFYRLFMAPGMLHCVGGPGPNSADWQGAISAWVERGQAPDHIIAAKFVDDTPSKGLVRTRPLCPFPKVATWSGRGDRNRAESFVCAAPADAPG
jgi:feruloyl esterase